MNMNELLDDDLQEIMDESDGWAEDAVVILSGDPPARLDVRIMFDDAGSSASPGHAPVASRTPKAWICESALPRELSKNDRMDIRGKTYRMQQPVPDGFGLLEVRLAEVR